MRHRMANRKLGRTSAHRSALFRNQLSSMLASERIITTLPKAKELRPIVEKMVTLGKNDSVHARRTAARSLQDDTLVQKLFTEISPRFAERPGGYTRIVKLGPRRGDAAEMAILEFIDFTLGEEKPEAPARKSSKKAASKKKAEPAESAEGEESTEVVEEKPAKKKPAAKKAAPKKTAAKKPAAKKSSSKKAPAKKTATRSKKGQ